MTHVGTIDRTLGPSMLPTISVKGDMVLISHYYRRGRGVRVGDVVSFRHPMEPEAAALKRVTGLPGDLVLTGAKDFGGESMMIQVRRNEMRIYPGGRSEVLVERSS